jgi:hypothetical protein
VINEVETQSGNVFNQMDFEDSKKACEALETLTKLGVINWHEPEDDEFEIVASISLVAHSGFAFSPYLHVIDPRGIAEFGSRSARVWCGRQSELSDSLRHDFSPLGRNGGGRGRTMTTTDRLPRI